MNARTILFLSMLTAGCLPPLDSDIKVDTLDTGDSRVDTEDTYLTDTDSPDDTGDTSDPVDTGDTSDPVDTGDTGEQYPEQCGREDTCTDCFTPTSMTVMAGFGYDAERGTMEPYTMNGYELGNYMTITFRDDGGATCVLDVSMTADVTDSFSSASWAGDVPSVDYGFTFPIFMGYVEYDTDCNFSESVWGSNIIETLTSAPQFQIGFGDLDSNVQSGLVSSGLMDGYIIGGAVQYADVLYSGYATAHRLDDDMEYNGSGSPERIPASEWNVAPSNAHIAVNFSGPVDSGMWMDPCAILGQ